MEYKINVNLGANVYGSLVSYSTTTTRPLHSSIAPCRNNICLQIRSAHRANGDALSSFVMLDEGWILDLVGSEVGCDVLL